MPDPTLAFERQVQDFLAAHWHRFQAVGAPPPPQEKPARQLARLSLAEQVYARLTSYRFCKQKPEDVEAFLAVIQTAMQADRPIPVILGHGPLKNPNNCPQSQVDWAEWFTLSQLAWLHQAIRALYPPGLQVSLFLDDARSHHANAIGYESTERYRHSLVSLIEQVGLRSLVTDVVALSDWYDEFGVGDCVTEAEKLVNRFEADPDQSFFLAQQYQHALRNLPATPGSEDPQGLHQQAEAAAHRYRVYLQAEILSGIWSIPNRLYGRFSPHPGFWQLFTLRKGSVTQPWQGQGCLKYHAGDKLEPFVMTRHKAAHHELLDTVTSGLSLKGFEAVPIYVETAEPIAAALPVRSGVHPMESVGVSR
jgi:hypothetical protein